MEWIFSSLIWFYGLTEHQQYLAARGIAISDHKLQIFHHKIHLSFRSVPRSFISNIISHQDKYIASTKPTESRAYPENIALPRYFGMFSTGNFRQN